MASEVMLTAVDRLRIDSRLPADVEAASRLWQPQRLEGSVALQHHEIDTAERPPLSSLG
jgi:hypothetical protein